MEIIPCKQATYLIVKREERSLTLKEIYQLIVHLIVCVFCRRFLEQSRLISKGARRLTFADTLSAEEKRKMQESLGLL